MANEPVMTVVGNLTGDPELRWTQSGQAVVNFNVAQNPRNYDKQSNQWVDGDPIYLRCTVWRDYAEHVAETLRKGMQIIVYGKLKCRQYQDKNGNPRTSWELDVDEVGPTLRFATAQVTRAVRQGQNQGQQQPQQNQQWGGQPAQNMPDNPQPPQQQGFDAWGGQGSTGQAPPF